MLKVLTQYKGIAQAIAGDGKTILFWQDLWNGRLLRAQFPQLYSYTNNETMTLEKVFEMEEL